MSYKQLIKDYYKKNPDQVGKVNRKELRKYLKIMEPPSNKHQGREPRKWEGCPICKKSNVRHYARGLCSICYRKLKKGLVDEEV